MNEDTYLSAILANDAKSVAEHLDRRSHLLEHRWQDNYRPLHWAALYGCEQVVKLLLGRGASAQALVQVPRECPSGDSNVCCDHQMRLSRGGWSARDFAVHGDFPQVAERLRLAGAPAIVHRPGRNPQWWHGVTAGYRRF